MAENINVCIASDDGYSKYAGVVIASVLANADSNDNLCFYILDGGISENNKEKILSEKSIKDCEINFVKVDSSLFDDYKSVKTNQYLSIVAYYRLKMSDILPDVQKVIYLDCDVVVNSSLKEFFNLDLGGCPVCGVRDINKRMLVKNPGYVNSGVLVMDLAEIRARKIEDKFLDWTRENADTIKMGDQEIINEVLKGDIKIAEDCWNVQSSNFTNRSSYVHKPNIIHFVSKRKPWHFGSYSYHKKYYFKYLQLTPWALSPMEYFRWTHINQVWSVIKYLFYRPLFFARPRFYEAVYYTYFRHV